MKVTVVVDCSADEARQFFGLPDVKPMQAAVMAQLEKQAVETVSAMSPEALMRAWFPFLPQGTEQIREAFSKLFLPFISGQSASGDPGRNGGSKDADKKPA